MVNTNGWQANFIQRCEAVGWSVERTKSNHFKVRDAKSRFLFTFPTTPGDVRSMQNTLSDAKRHGILDLEKQVKLRDERDRLERIQKDREASEAVEAEATLERIEADLKKIDRSVEHHSDPDPDLGNVDGVAIVMSGPAMYKTPVMSEPRPLHDAEELLLADDKTVWRCLKSAATKFRPDAEGVCHKVYLSVESLKSHLAYHSRIPAATTDSEREKEEEKVPTPAQTPNGARPEFDALDRSLAQLQAGIKKVADTLPNLIIEVGTLRDAVRKLPVVDQATIDKAAQFDALGAIFKNAAGK